MTTMTATAPGKLILTGEYAVLDGAPALVVAVDRRVVARVRGPVPAGSSPFLVAVARELAVRRGDKDPAVRAAMGIAVDSSAFFQGTQKLGLGSSAAVTVAATALALAEVGVSDLREILTVASAAHAAAQGAKGARGSGADIAAAVHGGTLVFTTAHTTKLHWPAEIRLVPFFTGASADTATLVARVAEARVARPTEVNAALAAVATASEALCNVATTRMKIAASVYVDGFRLAGVATERLATATGVALVPGCVIAARSAMHAFGGTAKTTGAGGGDIGIAVIPATVETDAVTRALVAAGCQPLRLSVDETGVDLRPAAA
jgi:phosphomevalonate kinase